MYRCLSDIACGLDYLHSAGVVHGDLKNANVLCSSSRPVSRAWPADVRFCDRRSCQHDSAAPLICKLADFGLSRIMSADASHLTTRTYGTISHMPPELLRNGIMSRAADVFSFAMLSMAPFSVAFGIRDHIKGACDMMVLSPCGLVKKGTPRCI